MSDVSGLLLPFITCARGGFDRIPAFIGIKKMLIGSAKCFWSDVLLNVSIYFFIARPNIRQIHRLVIDDS